MYPNCALAYALSCTFSERSILRGLTAIPFHPSPCPVSNWKNHGRFAGICCSSDPSGEGFLDLEGDEEGFGEGDAVAGDGVVRACDPGVHQIGKDLTDLSLRQR